MYCVLLSQRAIKFLLVLNGVVMREVSKVLGDTISGHDQNQKSPKDTFRNTETRDPNSGWRVSVSSSKF